MLFDCLNFYLLNIFLLHCVFVAACRLSLVAASGGYSLAVVCGFPLLQSTGSRVHGRQ